MARLLPEALQFSWRTDHDLVTAVRRGEDGAFEQLFSRYRTADLVLRERDPRRRRPGRGRHAGGVHLGPAPDAGHRAPDRVQAVDLPDREERLHRRAPADPPQPRGPVRPAARVRERASTICSRALRAPTSRSRASSSSRTCAPRSGGCRMSIIGSSSCASSRVSPTARSASGWGCRGRSSRAPCSAPGAVWPRNTRS